MGTKNRNVTNGILMLIFVIATAAASTSCKKISGCVTTTGYNEYLVEIPVKLYPEKDTFVIGDTLWLEQNFSDQIHDLQNNMTLNFKNFDFLLQMGISDLINYNQLFNNYDVFAEIGTAKKGGSLGAIYAEYDYKDGYYQNKMGIVLKEKGLFLLDIRSMRQYDNIDLTRCPTENLDIRYSVNDKAENNFHMMKDSKDTNTVKTTKEEFDKFGSYCFFVK